MFLSQEYLGKKDYTNATTKISPLQFRYNLSCNPLVFSSFLPRGRIEEGVVFFFLNQDLQDSRIKHDEL